jgi:hypothetical protein
VTTFMIPQSNHRRTHRLARTAFAAFVLAGASLAVVDRPAFADGPFSALAGSWSGGGTVMLSNGGRERISCRATYSVGSGGNSLQQTLRCASDSYNFQLSSSVTASGGSISGSWSEATRNVNGRVSGRVRGNQIDALVDAAGFSASITIVTHGNRQSVSIRSRGEFSGASISLSRR